MNHINPSTPLFTKLSPQQQQVLGYLLKHGSITAREAATEFQCWRLAAVVHRLRQMGYPVKTRMEPHPGGEHARYILDRTFTLVQQLG